MPPVVIAGVVAGAASIGGAVLSSRSTSRAATQASDAQTQNTAQNNALTREIYNRNTGNFTPYMQSGARANSLIDSFIYGPQQTQQAQPAQAPQGGFPANGFNGGAGFNALMPGGAPAGIPRGEGSDSWSLDSSYDGGQGYGTGGTPGYDMGGAYPGGQVPGGVTTPASNMSGWDAFVASPYYQNPLAEGYRALNGGLASSGRLESGDAVKRAIRYGQDYNAGRQGEFLNLVGTQANRGFGAASALAGVGQNMVNNVTANNNNAADAISNSALLRAQANNSMYSGIAGGLGTIAGGIFNRSSYGKGY